MKYLIHILALTLSLSVLLVRADDRVMYEGIPFYRYQIPTYTFTEFTPQLVLRMDYAKFEVSQEQIDQWSRLSQRHVPYEIDLVFTLYPKNIKAWRTNFDELLRNRLYTLLAADSTLRNKNIRWNMILQTDCQTEEEAKSYFHGFVIKYRPKKVRIIDEVKTPTDLKALLTGYARSRDSTVFKVMERHPEWHDLLVVMDWTGSMYKFGAQLVLWHKYRTSTNNSRIRHFVFFNDGNKRTTNQKVIGRTGGVYRARTTELEEIVKMMLFVMKKGNGGDSPENDLEALLAGIQYLEGYDEVVLIADNKSDVRDIELLDKVDRPVRIILCDVKNGIHPDYLQLAFKTGGSIHTLHDDLYHEDEALQQYGVATQQD